MSNDSSIFNTSSKCAPGHLQMPIGWKSVHLESVANVQTGLAKGKKIFGESVMVPYLRVANVQDGHLDLTEVKTISIRPNEIDRYTLREGDVLFTEGGDYDKLGRGTVWRGEIPSCLHQNHIFSVRPKPHLLLPEYLAYLASSFHGRRYFQAASKQSTNLASINSTQLKKFPVLLPPLNEQQMLVEVLQTWDAAIEKLEALAQAKAQLRDVVVQKLFAPSQPSRKTKDWGPTTFGQVFSERQDRNCGLDSESVVTVGKYAIRKQAEHFTRSVASADLSNYWVISPGDFVYDPMSAYYGALGQYTGESDGIVSPAYRVIQLRANVVPGFMIYLLKSHRIKFLLESRSSQGNKEGKRRLLQRDEFADIDFLLPPMGEQQRISAIVSTFEQDLAGTSTQIEKVKSQKRGLMQKLLTGGWRIKL